MQREFYAAARSKKGHKYIKSGMISLRSGLNHHLHLPPHSHIISLMWNDKFQNANVVFKGHLHENKENGLDTSESKQPILKHDLEKLYKEYFVPRLAAGNTIILQHKVFLIYFITLVAGERRFESTKQDILQIEPDP